MAGEQSATSGPDLEAGIAVAAVPEGKLVGGHVGTEAVLLSRRGGEWFAVGAVCSHYSGPLPEGLMVGDTVRCPWHHACFSLRTGEALRPPALNDITCWTVEQDGEMVYVRRPAPKPDTGKRKSTGPDSVLIIGAGAAGECAAGGRRPRAPHAACG